MGSFLSSIQDYKKMASVINLVAFLGICCLLVAGAQGASIEIEPEKELDQDPTQYHNRGHCTAYWDTTNQKCYANWDRNECNDDLGYLPHPEYHSWECKCYCKK